MMLIKVTFLFEIKNKNWYDGVVSQPSRSVVERLPLCCINSVIHLDHYQISTVLGIFLDNSKKRIASL